MQYGEYFSGQSNQGTIVITPPAGEAWMITNIYFERGFEGKIGWAATSGDCFLFKIPDDVAPSVFWNVRLYLDENTRIFINNSFLKWVIWDGIVIKSGGTFPYQFEVVSFVTQNPIGVPQSQVWKIENIMVDDNNSTRITRNGVDIIELSWKNPLLRQRMILCEEESLANTGGVLVVYNGIRLK